MIVTLKSLIIPLKAMNYPLLMFYPIYSKKLLIYENSRRSKPNSKIKNIQHLNALSICIQEIMPIRKLINHSGLISMKDQLQLLLLSKKNFLCLAKKIPVQLKGILACSLEVLIRLIHSWLKKPRCIGKDLLVLPLVRKSPNNLDAISIPLFLSEGFPINT